MKHVAVAIIINDKSVLICQRKRDARYGLKWEFPGGKVEPDESPEACVRRELREELSLELGALDKMEVEVSSYDDGGTFKVHYFYCRRFSGAPVNRVFEQFRWVQKEELVALDILHGNKEIVNRLIAGPLA